MKKQIIWAGNIPFKEWEHVREYKRILLEYHHISQKGKCFYCKCDAPLKEKSLDKAPSKNHATLEHLEQVWESKARWQESRELKKLRGIVVMSHGDLSPDNTVMACADCNNRRPWDRTVMAHKRYVAEEMQRIAA